MKNAGKISVLNDSSGKPVTGGFQVSNLSFSSPGIWTMTVSVKESDKNTETQTFTFEVK